MGQNKPNVPQEQMNMASDFYQKSQGAPSPIETEFNPTRQNLANTFTNAIKQNTADYGNIMGDYNAFKGSLDPTASRPTQVQGAYDTLDTAKGGYQNFMNTGGFSDQDIQNLRARGMAPITAAYGNTMRELDRARSLGGGGANAPNYIAAVSRAQRTLPQQLSDAEQGVNANLASMVQQGKEFGTTGMAQVGAETGQLAAGEAQRQDAAKRAVEQETLASIGGKGSLYGTTPGQASTFGNQVLNAYGMSSGMEGQRNAQGLQALGDYLNAFTGAKTQTPWWQTGLGIAGDVAPFFAV